MASHVPTSASADCRRDFLAGGEANELAPSSPKIQQESSRDLPISLEETPILLADWWNRKKKYTIGREKHMKQSYK